MKRYDLVVIGAGSGGLSAARFGAQIGMRVVLVEKDRIGGDCTWTGCVPSKALLRVAGAAHTARNASDMGVLLQEPVVDMAAVRAYVASAREEIYGLETPEVLAAEGIDVVQGQARFTDSHTIDIDGRQMRGTWFVLATGATPGLPAIDGLEQIPYVTSEQIFDNERLPNHLLVMGAGPVGCEVGQAYRRLGAQVTLIDHMLLPTESERVRAVMSNVFASEGVRFCQGMVSAASYDGRFHLTVGQEQLSGEMLLVATGRRPRVDDLALEAAGVAYTPAGIQVDHHLRTTTAHIYAIGDCNGHEQQTHYAGWQAYRALLNAVLPYDRPGLSTNVPRVIYTDPELARVGMGFEQAQREFGGGARMVIVSLDQVDRGIVDGRRDGFIELVHRQNGRILGATIVAPHASEMINEFSLLVGSMMTLSDLSQHMHAYPSYGIGAQILAGRQQTDNILSGWKGSVLRWFARRG